VLGESSLRASTRRLLLDAGADAGSPTARAAMTEEALEAHRAGRTPVPGAAPHARALELVPIEALTALAVASEEA